LASRASIPLREPLAHDESASLWPLLPATRASLLALAKARGLDPMSAQDVIQDAFVALLSNRLRIENVEAWLICVVGRRCTDWIRQRSRSRLAFVGELPERFDEPISEIQRLTITAIVGRLSPRQRRLIRARYFEGRSETEAAQEAGYAPSSYKKTMSRTLRKLREMLDLGDNPSARSSDSTV